MIKENSMSKWEKLLAKLNRISPELQFHELRKILLTYGFEETQPGRGGSPYTFSKGKTQIKLPRHQQMQKVYIKLVKEAVESEIKED